MCSRCNGVWLIFIVVANKRHDNSNGTDPPRRLPGLPAICKQYGWNACFLSEFLSLYTFHQGAFQNACTHAHSKIGTPLVKLFLQYFCSIFYTLNSAHATIFTKFYVHIMCGLWAVAELVVINLGVSYFLNFISFQGNDRFLPRSQT